LLTDVSTVVLLSSWKDPEMVLNFGKHRGKLLETVVLKEPGYIQWMLLCEDADGPLVRTQEEARQLITIFDARPFLRCCHNPSCDRSATYCSLYGGNLSPLWWCNECDACSAGAPRYKLNFVQRYMHAVWHVPRFCGKREESQRCLIRMLAEAKGLPERVTESAARAFFAYRTPSVCLAGEVLTESTPNKGTRLAITK
jgi:hypothetical protein